MAASAKSSGTGSAPGGCPPPPTSCARPTPNRFVCLSVLACLVPVSFIFPAVSPDNVNLCQAVSKVLATARRAKGLDAQLRLLAKCQRELLLQLEAQREAAARAERGARQWQVRRTRVCCRWFFD